MIEWQYVGRKGMVASHWYGESLLHTFRIRNQRVGTRNRTVLYLPNDSVAHCSDVVNAKRLAEYWLMDTLYSKKRA